MMKLILSLTLLWAISTTAGALQCQACTLPLDSLCSTTSTVTCTSETMCITAAAVAQGTVAGQQIIRQCATSSLCEVVATSNVSFNTLSTSAIVSAECCSTDNCNNGVLPFPTFPSVNGQTCPACNTSDPACTSTVQCRGEEDTCFTATVMIGVGTSETFGCTTEGLCTAAENLTDVQLTQLSLGTLISLNSCSPLTSNTTTTAPPMTNATSNITTAAQNATTSTPATQTTACDACCVRLGMISLLLGLLICTLY